MPLSFFQRDLDDIFAYQTPKVAKIKDRKLGLLRLGLMVCIAFYIIVWQILYKGQHLNVGPVNGVFRLQLQQPTVEGCDPFHLGCRPNFTSMRELSYCSQNHKPWTSPEDPLLRHKKLPCEYWDATELVQASDEGFLVPTRIEMFRQARGCFPSEANNWSCKGELYDFLDESGHIQSRSSGSAEPLRDVFIADMERFTLLIDHSFRRQGGMQAENMEMLGEWLDCPRHDATLSCKARKILCVHDKCPKGALVSITRGDYMSLLGLRSSHQARLRTATLRTATKSASKAAAKAGVKLEAEDGEGLAEERSGLALARKLATGILETSPVAVLKGDVFRMGQLLDIAGVSLDSAGNMTGETIRQRGVVVVIQIEYSNLSPWMGLTINPWSTGPTPKYKYRVTTRPSYDYRSRKVFGDPTDEIRTVREYHGVRLVVEQTGRMAVWDTMQFLLVLTTSLGLMAVSNYVTDFLAIYCLPRSADYARAKYQDAEVTDPLPAEVDHKLVKGYSRRAHSMIRHKIGMDAPPAKLHAQSLEKTPVLDSEVQAGRGAVRNPPATALLESTVPLGNQQAASART